MKNEHGDRDRRCRLDSDLRFHFVENLFWLSSFECLNRRRALLMLHGSSKVNSRDIFLNMIVGQEELAPDCLHVLSDALEPSIA
jgi:hypothetical protein